MKKIKLIFFFFRMLWRLDKEYCILLLISVVVKALFPFVNIIFPMYIVNELCLERRLNVMLGYIGMMIFLDMLFYCGRGILDRFIQLKSEGVTFKIQTEISGILAEVSYEKMEDAEFLDLESKAMFPVVRQNVIGVFGDQLSLICVCTIRLCGLVYILSLLSFWISIFLLFTIFVYCWCHKKLADITIRFSKELQPINRKFTYYIRMITNSVWAKDIRLFDAEPMISERVGEYNEKSYQTLKRMCNDSAKYNCIGKFCSVLQMIVSYLYVAWLAFSEKILIGQLTLYVNAMVQLTGNVSDLVNAVITLLERSTYLEEYVKFQKECLTEISAKPDGEGRKKCHSLESIEFKNITFSYKGSSRKVLDNISFKIEKGERVAIVGTNGAGKTTVVKLLLGFFKPDAGQIIINGTDMNEYDPQDLREKMTTVFQDFFLPDASISDNLTIGEKADEDKLQKVLMQSGFWDVLQKMPFREKTVIGKQFDKSGIELSGGQKQKLAVARMLYRNADIYVLDEPTAAHDPKSEKELYDKFNEFAKEKKDGLFLFISHRLSSCSFCNRILVFDDAKLVEEGAHEELLKTEGLYKRMWDAQKAYYE